MATISVGASTEIAGQGIPSTTNQIPQQGEEAQAPPKPYYDFNVTMTCGSCSGAVERALKKNIPEPNRFKVDLASQNVKVWGPSLPPLEDVKAKIAKTGKKINSASQVD